MTDTEKLRLWQNDGEKERRKVKKEDKIKEMEFFLNSGIEILGVSVYMNHLTGLKA